MLLSPRYEGPAVVLMDGSPADVAGPVAVQRRRLQEVVAGFGTAEWQHASRCEGWTGQDVIAHLVTVNGFWTASIAAGLAGEPTRMLAAFDPAATPPLLVDPLRALSATELLVRFTDSNEELLGALAALDDDGWEAVAEAPPGHVSVRVLAHHALWDAWVHERDILLPLGEAPVEDDAELAACLRYSAAVGPALVCAADPSRRGALVAEATDLGLRAVVEAGESVTVHGGPAPEGAGRVAGRAVDLVEGFSVRGPLDAGEVPEGSRWLLDGLPAVFDQP